MSVYDKTLFEETLLEPELTDLPVRKVVLQKVADTNMGSYNNGSGQIIFNSTTLTSSSQYINWRKACLEIPINVTSSVNANDGFGQATAAQVLTGAGDSQILLAGLKNSFTSIIDSITFSLNGSEILPRQKFNNYMCMFRLMSGLNVNDIKPEGSLS